jgi:hypothetical protein
MFTAFALFLGAPNLYSAKRNLADYSLRVAIYGTNWNRDRLGYHAFGRGNFFDEKGTPHGMEFTYDCGDHLMANPGTEAYPAKWKKPGQSLEVVFGEIGEKPDQFHVCEFKVSMKSYVFYRSDHGIVTDSPENFLAAHKSQTPAVGPATPSDVPVSANPNRD